MISPGGKDVTHSTCITKKKRLQEPKKGLLGESWCCQERRGAVGRDRVGVSVMNSPCNSLTNVVVLFLLINRSVLQLFITS